VISEIMAGVTGNNNYDFIELYNPTWEIIDLKGYSLWYQLNAAEPDTLLFSWETSALIPPHGYYLLLREGQDAGVEADAFFDYSLVPQRGSLGLQLRGASIVDQVAWGDSDSPFVEATTALAMHNDASLERLPGGQDGNGQDTDNNSLDFALNESPNPQNSASPPVPPFEGGLTITVDTPGESTPGSVLEYQINVANPGQEKQQLVIVVFPVPATLTYKNSSVEAAQDEGQLLFDLGEIASGQEVSFAVSFDAPWQYTTINVQGIYADAEGMEAPVFAGALRTELQGGSVPIGIARTLLGSGSVIVEGVASMYTGGLYAGSSGTKFYIEDETGGVQVYVPGGAGKVDVPLGAFVRVQGSIEPYRGAIELIPSPEDIELLSQPGEKPAREPLATTAKALQNAPDEYAGRLVTLSGEVVRVEEFSFSYEIDLLDDGVMASVYIDKLTEINVEAVAVGQYYQLTGIAEMLDDTLQVYPRVQTDLSEIQPPTVTMSARMPVNYDSTQTVTIEVLVSNHLDDTIKDLEVTLVIPDGFSIVEISEGGEYDAEKATWNWQELTGSGSQLAFSLTGNVSASQPYLMLPEYTLTYTGQPDALRGEIAYSFPGDSVPVWAIQGTVFRSPYLLQEVKTSGVVIGVFPELEGFWIQGIDDGDPRTSQGLFIYTMDTDLEVRSGDRVTVQGMVHEAHSETQLFLEDLVIASSNQMLPTAVVLEPPVDEVESELYYEALEGMLVQVKGNALAVSATNKFGETAIVLPPYDSMHLMQGGQNGFAMRVDDGSFVTHKDQSTMLYAAATGDLLSGIQGPLAYNYGYYKIEPLSAPKVNAQDRLLPQLPVMEGNQIRVMTWNVENLFDYLLPHPNDPALPSVAEYKAWLEKIANTILLAGTPVVIGLQEVEHIGILEDLADTSQLASFGYQAVLLEGTDSRGIDVGYLVRGDVQILEVKQFPAPEDLTSRPPLLLKVEVKLDAGPRTLYLLNNHFLSMSGGELATEPRRVAQAAWNAGLVEEIQSDDPKAQIIVMGDLNSYYDSPPIDTLREAGLVHVFDDLDPEERYTYIYQGIAQVLDHILVNEKLVPAISRLDILHVNSDFPLQLPGDTSVLHKSDHDPVVITLDF
jgi:predicted extracellular nuclease